MRQVAISLHTFCPVPFCRVGLVTEGKGIRFYGSREGRDVSSSPSFKETGKNNAVFYFASAL